MEVGGTSEPTVHVGEKSDGGTRLVDSPFVSSKPSNVAIEMHLKGAGWTIEADGVSVVECHITCGARIIQREPPPRSTFSRSGDAEHRTELCVFE